MGSYSVSNSNVPNVAFNDSGIVLPLESQILAGVAQDYNDAFGGNLNTALETPQGQLISSTTAIIGEKNAELALLMAQVDPDTASGVFQDAIARIYFINRRPATATTVNVTCGGVPGTVLPGLIVQDTSGNQYQNLSSGVIGSNGKTTLTFTALTTGAISCPAQTIVSVFKSVAGLETVTNDVAGVTGTDVESRIQFEQRRRQSVAINAQGSVDAIRASVASVTGVADILVAENTSNQTINIGVTNYPLVPHSIVVSVIGGSDSDIGKAIWQKKNAGCDMNGNTTVTVSDTTYSYPMPMYNIKFLRPTLTPLSMLITIAKNSLLPSNANQLIQNAVIKALTGTDGSTRQKMGDTIYASRFYSAISSISPLVQIIDVQIGKNGTANSHNITMGIDEMPVISASNIVINVV